MHELHEGVTLCAACLLVPYSAALWSGAFAVEPR